MGSYLQGDESNCLVHLTAARLLWLEALDGWQQEDLMPSWSPSATAFVRRKRDGGKKCLVTQDGILRAEKQGKASLLGELCVAVSAERSAPSCPVLEARCLVGWVRNNSFSEAGCGEKTGLL